MPIHWLPLQFKGERMEKLFSVIDEVEKFLTKYPVLRDDDEKLMANIWNSHIGNLEDVDGKEVLSMLANHKLPSYESISRCRRKLQEECPNLRGEEWYERHKRATIIKEEINHFYNEDGSKKYD